MIMNLQDFISKFKNPYTNIYLKSGKACIINCLLAPGMSLYNQHVSGNPVLFLLSNDRRFDGYMLDPKYKNGYEYSYVIHNEFTNQAVQTLMALPLLNKNIKVL